MEILNQAVPLWAVLLYVVFMAAVQALPRPDDLAGRGYTFLYRFAHMLSANIALVLEPRKDPARKMPCEPS